MTAAGEPPEAVFFDAAGTLLQVRETVGTIYRKQAADGAEAGAAQALDAVFSGVFEERQPLLFPEASDAELPGLEQRWWREVVDETFRRAGMGEVDGAAFSRIYSYFAGAAAWRLEPGARRVLDELRARGYRLAVVSNFDSRLPRLLEELGVARYFHEVTVSSLVRAAKPDPAIFAHALQRVGVEAGGALHVGDNPAEDVAGALAAGLRAVLYDPAGAKPAQGVQRIRALPELLTLLV